MVIKPAYKSINGDYVFSKCIAEAEKYKSENKIKLIDLSVGDVCLPPIKSVSRALKKAVRKYLSNAGFSGYPPDEGYMPLRRAISEDYKRQGAYVYPEEIFINTGAKPALSDILEIADFSRAFIHSPVYPLYGELCAARNINTDVFCNLPDISENSPIANIFNDKDLFFLCSPCNPTGESFNLDFLKNVIHAANKNYGAVIIDGAYAAFKKDYLCPYNIAGAEKSVIEIRSYSKSLSFTGLRCGYVVIKKQNPLHEPFKKMLTLKHNGVNILAQKAALGVYSQKGFKELKYRIDYYEKNAQILLEPFLRRGFSAMHGEAPYVFVKTKTSGEEFTKELLNRFGILVCPGAAFGGNEYIRLSCLCKREQAENVAKRLATL